MKEYHKIHSVYKRDDRGRFILGDFAKPEFEYLWHHSWLWTEKIDGTNVRIGWDGDTVRFGGKTDRAQLPAQLFEKLQALFPADNFRELDLPAMTLYGEGFGGYIQKVGVRYGEIDFILFDIRVGDFWLRRDDVEDIAERLGVFVVPQLWEKPATLEWATEFFQQGVEAQLKSRFGDAPMEGVVGRPVGDFLDRSGARIITKLKFKDFARLA